MKKIFLLIGFTSLLLLQKLNAQYNNLWIPDTLSGSTFNLNIKDTFSQIRPGQQTITAGINNKFWGPTLFINKGDTVHMNVRNYLNDSTTLHWHGMHLPAVMDGGPHQIIPPGTLWQPYWKVANNAATYWYHPHLHEMAMEQITKGVGGLIIVRDSIESALALPRKYGIDDIPLVLTDRDFTTANQFSVVPYGDSSMVNGVLSPQFTIPSQVVRFRILNAAIERSYNLGFSDNRSFFVITSDGGLLNQPISLTRYLLSPGERIEILVNCGGQSGTSFDLKAYNSTISQFIAGGENFPNGPFANALGRLDFRVLHLNVGAQTTNPITAIPTVLTNNVFPSLTNANITRTITISDSTAQNFPGVTILGPNAFLINRKMFSISYNEYNIPLNNTEIWELKSTSVFAHPFHIHDVEFYILTRNGVAPPAAEQGWKDVVLVKANETVRFIAKFDDYADNIHPFMYHCHIALHEDEGMMGQFIVGSTTVSPAISTLACSSATYSSNPTANTVYSGTAAIGYTGGNGVAYTAGISVSSTNVTGLTATLQAGTLASGSGNITYTITGTPSAAGTAVFAITFGGQSCNISLTVNNVTPPPSSTRNVMFIIADDMGTDYLGFYENHQDTVDVPNLRYLVNHGIRFSNATSDPVCSATRATMITGRYGFRTGVGGIVGGVGGSGQLDTTEITIPKLLKVYNNNIKKSLIGKWHLQQPAPINLTAPNRMGFDHYEGLFIGTLTPNYNNWTKITNGVSSTSTNYATTEQANNMTSWLRQNSSSPFYACLSFNAPHDPIHLPPAGLHSFTNLSGAPADIAANPKSYYKAMIQSMDHELGRVFDSLRALNKFDSTDFIFIGDNGSIARVAQIADTSRAKGTIYEYGVHVPLIISGPSVVNPGRVSNALVNSTDIFATVLELYGYNNWQSQIPVNKPVDSKSLMPIIKNQRDSIRPWAFTEIFKTTTDSSDGKAIKNKNYKLIRFNDGRERFYHLSVDANELNNLLVGSMNLTDSINYAYLCNQLTSLVGIGVYCPSPVTSASVTSLDCNQVNYSSTDVYVNTPFNSIATIPYLGGNGVVYSIGNSISSTGVAGLTATLEAGQLTNGVGNLIYTISGIPSSTGTANFATNFGGQSCSFFMKVDSLNSANYNTAFDFGIISNPVNNKLQVKMKPLSRGIYYAWVYDALGRTIFMWPNPTELISTGKDVSILSKGIYMLKIMDDKNKQVLTRKFIKQ
jgi:FtsP/CotA-like multicopper oxidase with cupredoxin domain/arylsulfatase A-like enzyme